MGNVYTSPTLSGYNDNAPPDDGSNTAANEVTWSGIKTKLADPLKTQTDAMNSAITTAFGKNLFNSIEAESANYTVVSGDRGKLISCTNTITITLLAASSAGAGFAIAIRNNGTGTVTVDGNASETINGSATYTLAAGDTLVIVSDGSNWEGLSTGNPSGYAVSNGFTRQAPNMAVKEMSTSNWSDDFLHGSGAFSVSAPSNANYVEIAGYLKIPTGTNYEGGFIESRDSTDTYEYDKALIKIAQNSVTDTHIPYRLIAKVYSGSAHLYLSTIVSSVAYGRIVRYWD